MRHMRSNRELGRGRNQRRALLKTLLGSLIMHEKIETTEAKAKELKGKIDKLIGKVKKNQDKTKKLAMRKILKKDLPDMAAEKIMGEFLKKFAVRNSGYTRIIKLMPRKSDNARLAVIEFV
jgi:large subunit ribosomal protein L17